MSQAQIEKLVGLLRERGRPAVMTPAVMRARMEEMGDKFPAPADVIREPGELDGVPMEWVSAPGSAADRAVFYLHGGGYVQGNPHVYRNLAYGLSKAAKARVAVLDYGLAPEHPFPRAVKDSTRAWRALVGLGYKPERLAIAGDSAGGGLTVSTLVNLRYMGEPLPACAWCLSPWTDLAATGASVQTKAAEDPMLDAEYLAWFATHYLQGKPSDTPLASPLYADLTGLPALLVQVGSAEVLLDDSVRLVERARAAGVDATLEVAERMVHVWPLFAPMLDEGRAAIDRAGAFILKHTP